MAIWAIMDENGGGCGGCVAGGRRGGGGGWAGVVVVGWCGRIGEGKSFGIFFYLIFLFCKGDLLS